MKIHGLRIYRKGFFGIFCPLAAAWRGHVFANDFGVRYGADGRLEDPMPSLRARFGSGLLAADVNSQLVLLGGDEFGQWGPSLRFCEGALLPIFRGRPPFKLLNRLYWERDFRLTSDTWPIQMRAVLHMWDDMYWQMFTTERSDVDTLIRAHGTDPKARMYFSDLDREYPDPSNQELQIAALSGPTGDA